MVIETKDVVTIILSFTGVLIMFASFLSARSKNKVNLKITIDYVRQNTISNEPRAIVDLPKIEERIDQLLAEITLTNAGDAIAIIDKVGLTINDRDIMLEYCNPLYFTSTAPNATVHGGFSEMQYISKSGEKLGKIESKHKEELQIKSSLFLHDVKDVFVVDTLNKKWSVDKKSLNTFYAEFRKNNPAPYPRVGEVPSFFKSTNKVIELTPPARRWSLKISRSEIVSIIVGVLLTGTPWWWGWLVDNHDKGSQKQIAESVYRQGKLYSPDNKITEPVKGEATKIEQVNPPNNVVNTPKVEQKKHVEINKVERGSTGLFLDGDIKVSVIEVVFENGIRGKVSAKIDGFGMSDSMTRADVGTLVKLKKGQTIYEVRLHEIGDFSAKFSVEYTQ